MANSITQETVYGSATSELIVRRLVINGDGSTDTNLVVYDNSALINDVSKGSLTKIIAIGAGNLATFSLKWDQTTDYFITYVNYPRPGVIDFSDFGGIKNPNQAGATGDILLSGTFAAGGHTIFLFIRQD